MRLPFFAVATAVFLAGLCAAQSADERLVTVGGAVTETVFALGFGSEVVAVDSTSLHPEAVTKLPQVGYERTLAAEGILSQHPSFLIATSDAGPPGVIEQVRAAGVRVVIVPAEPSVEGAQKKIQAVADALGKSARGKELIEKIDAEITTLPKAKSSSQRRRVLFIYARGGGIMNVSGTGTAADAIIQRAGGRNAVTEYQGYKPLTAEGVVTASPEIILITSRGLEGIGGIDRLLALPGLGETPAGRARRVVAMDDLKLLGFGPRTGEAMVELAKEFEK
jgi:iron complex transport system substrate-binding protein